MLVCNKLRQAARTLVQTVRCHRSKVYGRIMRCDSLISWHFSETNENKLKKQALDTFITLASCCMYVTCQDRTWATLNIAHASDYVSASASRLANCYTQSCNTMPCIEVQSFLSSKPHGYRRVCCFLERKAQPAAKAGMIKSMAEWHYEWFEWQKLVWSNLWLSWSYLKSCQSLPKLCPRITVCTSTMWVMGVLHKLQIATWRPCTM